jgi:hypothetical protein
LAADADICVVTSASNGSRNGAVADNALRSGVVPSKRKREEERLVAECHSEILRTNATLPNICESFRKHGQTLGVNRSRELFIVRGNSKHPADRKAADEHIELCHELLQPSLAQHGVECFLAPGSIRSGEEWNSVVMEHLRRAKWAVLWVTAAFLNSWYVQHRELPFLVEAKRQGKVQLFLILGQECCWEQTNFLPELQWAIARDKPLEARQRRSQRRILKGLCGQLEDAFAKS